MLDKIKNCRVCGKKLVIKRIKNLMTKNNDLECAEGKKVKDAWFCNDCLKEIKEEI